MIINIYIYIYTHTYTFIIYKEKYLCNPVFIYLENKMSILLWSGKEMYQRTEKRLHKT